MSKISYNLKVFMVLVFIIIVIFWYVRKKKIVLREYMTTRTNHIINNIPDFKDNILNVYDNHGK